MTVIERLFPFINHNQCILANRVFNIRLLLAYSSLLGVPCHLTSLLDWMHKPYVQNNHKFTSVEEGMRLGQIIDNRAIRKSREMDTSVAYHVEKPRLLFVRLYQRRKLRPSRREKYQKSWAVYLLEGRLKVEIHPTVDFSSTYPILTCSDPWQRRSGRFLK